MKIADEQFNRTISLADAYKVMCKFIEQYNFRGETSTLELLSGISLDLWSDGGSADPAHLGDFLATATEVLGPPLS